MISNIIKVNVNHTQILTLATYYFSNEKEKLHEYALKNNEKLRFEQEILINIHEENK